MAKKKDRTQIYRTVIQIFFVLLILFIAIRKGIYRGEACLHAFCPFGGIETLYTYLFGGYFIQKARPSNLILLIAVVLMTVVFGRFFCGWICPFGSISEWLGKLGKKIFGKQLTVPSKIDKPLRYLKYVIFVLILCSTIYYGSMVFADFDPYVALFRLIISQDAAIAGSIILAVVLIGSIFIERFWCRYACPLGAVLAILNKISFFKVRIQQESCKGCKRCVQQKCPVNVQMSEKGVASTECIWCFECADACPFVAISIEGPKRELQPEVKTT